MTGAPQNDNGRISTISADEFDAIVRETCRTMHEHAAAKGCERWELMSILEAVNVASIEWLYEATDRVEVMEELASDVIDMMLVKIEDDAEGLA